MDLKPQPNHELYIQVLRRMTPAQRLRKSLEMSALAKRLFRAGLRRSFSNLTEEELQKLYIDRLNLCHNRNW